jgi:hypothetical protein
MEFIFQKGSNPDDSFHIRRRDRTSYIVRIRNRTEDYTSEGVLQDYEIKEYVELLYLSALEDHKPYDFVQMNFPFFPGILRNLAHDRVQYAAEGYDFSFLETFAALITRTLQVEEWPAVHGSSTNSEETLVGPM